MTSELVETPLHQIDLRPFLGRVTISQHDGAPQISAGVDSPPLRAKAGRLPILNAIQAGQESYSGTLEEYALAQLAQFHFFNSGTLSRVIDYDCIVETLAPVIRPFVVSFVLTKLCNLRCLHCYNNSGRKDKSELTSDQKLSFIEYLGRWGVAELILTGGEPTLDPAFPEILTLAKRYRLRTKVTTNAWNVSKAMLDAICDNTVQQVNVSLDGIDADTHDYFRGRPGSFTRVMRALEVFQESRVRLLILNVSVHRHSLGQLEQLTRLAVARGCTAISFKTVVSTGRPDAGKPEFLLNDRDVRHFQRERDRLRVVFGSSIEIDGKLIAEGLAADVLEKVKCNAGTGAMVVEANGTMLPCETLDFVPTAPNLKSVSPSHAWTGDPVFQWFRNLAKESSGGCGTSGCPGCKAKSAVSSTTH